MSVRDIHYVRKKCNATETHSDHLRMLSDVHDRFMIRIELL